MERQRERSVILSTATPLEGAHPWTDTGLVDLKDRHARETRAPQFARVLLHSARGHCGAGVPPARSRFGFVIGSERVEESPEGWYLSGGHLALPCFRGTLPTSLSELVGTARLRNLGGCSAQGDSWCFVLSERSELRVPRSSERRSGQGGAALLVGSSHSLVRIARSQ